MPLFSKVSSQIRAIFQPHVGRNPIPLMIEPTFHTAWRGVRLLAAYLQSPLPKSVRFEIPKVGLFLAKETKPERTGPVIWN